MAKSVKRNDKTLLVTVPEAGDPTFQFTGVWTAGMFERMYRKAARALRQSKVKMAQAQRDFAEAEKAANITQEVE